MSVKRWSIIGVLVFLPIAITVFRGLAVFYELTGPVSKLPAPSVRVTAVLAEAPRVFLIHCALGLFACIVLALVRIRMKRSVGPDRPWSVRRAVKISLLSYIIVFLAIDQANNRVGFALYGAGVEYELEDEFPWQGILDLVVLISLLGLTIFDRWKKRAEKDRPTER